jgi:hypothetical protein
LTDRLGLRSRPGLSQGRDRESQRDGERVAGEHVLALLAWSSSRTDVSSILGAGAVLSDMGRILPTQNPDQCADIE